MNRETHRHTETVYGLIKSQARAFPKQTAIIDGETEISYEHLMQRANAIAGELITRGLTPGSLVGICMSRSWELMAALVGVLQAGCAYVPLDPAYPKQRIRYMLEHARLAAAIVDEQNAADLCLGVSKLIFLGEIGQHMASDLPNPSPTDLAYVLYTSGSTGRPKGVAVEHRSVVALSQSMRGLLSDEELTGVLAAASVCFDASVMEILGTLSLGGTVIVAENVLQLLELPAADRVRTCIMVPSAMKVLLAAGQLPEGIRCVVLGAEVLKRSLANQLRAQNAERRVINVYGPTEDTVYSTTVEVPVGTGTITIGKSIAGSRSYILNESMQPVPTGVEGELYLAGDKLARGYLYDEELTKERFLELKPTEAVPEERLYKTGDLCRRREDGEIEFLSRIDQQVKIRGHRIELEEIEATLETLDGVDSAAAAAVEVDDGQKMLVGYMVTRNTTVTSETARAHLAEQLPKYMVPQVVMLLDELPRLPNDKLDRKGLPKPAPDQHLNQLHNPAANANHTSDLEKHLAGLSQEKRHALLLSTIRGEIASLLRFQDPEQVRPDDLLDELGLDSLSKVELNSRLGSAINRKLPVSAIMQRSTPSAVADYLLKLTGNSTESMETVRDHTADTLNSFQAKIQAVYPPFLAAKAPAWSATDKGTLVQQLKQLVSRPGDPFCKLVRTGSGHRGIVADVDTDRAREAIIWTTNLYLGLNRDPTVIAEAKAALEHFGTGMGTSAAASGITDLHLEFEHAFAKLVGKPAACLFPTGYTANVGAIAGLLGNNDVIVMDQLCHASIVDGARLCGATIRTFQHNNPADLEAILKAEASPYRTILVAIEGVYSMGEGAAPVLDIARTAKKYNALVLVDEAHSFGFYGPRGGGLCAAQGATEQVDFIMTTLSKALGSLGGVVAAREEHVALLKSSARAFIFQASTSPADIAAALAALRRLRTDDTLRERLWDTTTYMRKQFTKAGYDLGTGDGPIVTPHFPDKNKLFAVVNGLFERGIHTSAVTYPIVESGRGRLRFICSAAHSREQVDKTLEALIDAEREADAMQPTAGNGSTNTHPAQPAIEEWANRFSAYLRKFATKAPDLLPDLAISVSTQDGQKPLTILFNKRDITVETHKVKVQEIKDIPFCSLRFTNHQAISALCSPDVPALLDNIIKGTCVLNGQTEPFIWLIGRMDDWQHNSFG